MTGEIQRLPFDRPGPFSPPREFAKPRRAPVIRALSPTGEPVWLVVEQATVREMLSDRRFTMTRPGVRSEMGSMQSDGEPHLRLRRLVARAFTPRAVAAIRPRVEELAAGYVAELKRQGPGADLVSIVGRPLPLAVTSDMLGVRLEDRDRFYDWADAASGVAAAASLEGFEEIWGELAGFINALIAAKRVEPGDDLLSSLIAVRDTDDGRLDDGELMTTAISILMGGYLSVTNAITIGVVKLTQAGGLAALNVPGAAALAVEEILRCQVGLAGDGFPRWASTDVELGGQLISAGDKVMASLEGANHDPGVFTDPECFDPSRDPNPHLGFGHGPHHCLGAALARIEVTAVISALASELPKLDLACRPEEVEWTGNPFDNGPAVLPVTW